jgi:phosphoadenosine phosphosulfate reductase
VSPEEQESVRSWVSKNGLCWCVECNVPVSRHSRCCNCGRETIPVETNLKGETRPLLPGERRAQHLEELIPDEAWLILTDNTDLSYNVLVDGKIIGDLVFQQDHWTLKVSSRATDAPKYFPPAIIVHEAVQWHVVGLSQIRGPWVRALRPVFEGEYVVFRCGKVLGLAQCLASMTPSSAPTSGYALRIISITDSAERKRVEGKTDLARVTTPVRFSDLDIDFRKRLGTALKANLENLEALESKALDRIDTAVRGNPGKPLAVSFSGGKDSALVTELLRQYHRRFNNASKMYALFADTSIEFPETYRYTRAFFADKRYSMFELVAERPEKEFYEMWDEFGPPSRYARWCCGTQKLGPINAILAKFGSDVLVCNGSRAGESVSRSRRTIVDTNPYVDGQITVQPILDWSLLEVWLYLFWRDVLINPLYSMGFNRTGCYACPYSSDSIFWTVARTHPQLMLKIRQNLSRFGIETKTHDWRFRGREILANENQLETEPCGGGTYSIKPRLPMLLDIHKVGLVLKNKYRLMETGETALVFKRSNASITLSRSGRFLVRGVKGRRQAEKIYQDVMSFVAASEKSCNCVGCGVVKG